MCNKSDCQPKSCLSSLNTGQLVSEVGLDWLAHWTELLDFKNCATSDLDPGTNNFGGFRTSSGVTGRLEAMTNESGEDGR
jgi:hypothetical protein